MKSFALMCKRTGNILEGHRISFIDVMNTDDVFGALPGSTWKVCLLEHMGWLVTSTLPESGLGGFFIFMNVKWVEENFEILGEI